LKVIISFLKIPEIFDITAKLHNSTTAQQHQRADKGQYKEISEAKRTLFFYLSRL
jgi:hypothetical protein